MVWLPTPTPSFRILGALLALIVGHQSQFEACAEEIFPYVAYVVHADSYVRSGPGQRYYPTQQLPQGFAMEVHRHDDGGWCAIRPPEGSFSWIAAHEVRLVEPNVAEVVAERAVTRVGSALSPTRSAVQVLLERGERIAVAPSSSNDDPSWIRVIPPAGEFRWIAARDLGRQAPLEVSPPTTPSAQAWSRPKSLGLASPVTVGAEPSLGSTASDAFSHLQQTSANVSTVPSATITPPVTFDTDPVDIIVGSPADLQLAQYQGQGITTASAGQSATTTTSSPVIETTSPRIRLSGMSGARRIAQEQIPEWVKEIELRLSQMVAEPRDQWHFDQIQLEANSMLQQAELPAVRTQLLDLIERLARFQQIRDGYGQIAQTPVSEEEFPVPELGAPVDPMAELVENVRQRVREDFANSGGENAGEVIDKPLYDAVGLLKPVVSRRNNAPQYALVNGKGDVVSFVTPTPDINLKPYVGRRIGVNGTRGFMNEFRRAHVTAGRVTPIETSLRR